jgi:flagellar M-ring protein FliF
MGFSKDRGDSLNVVNTAFSEPEREPVAELPLWKQPETLSIAKEAGKDALFAAVVAYLFFGVVRPMLRQAASAPPPVEVVPAPLPMPADAGGVDPLLRARKLAREDPKIVANVVKSWVGKDG